jgi:hypothetical protein
LTLTDQRFLKRKFKWNTSSKLPKYLFVIHYIISTMINLQVNCQCYTNAVLSKCQIQCQTVNMVCILGWMIIPSDDRWNIEHRQKNFNHYYERSTTSCKRFETSAICMIFFGIVGRGALRVSKYRLGCISYYYVVKPTPVTEYCSFKQKRMSERGVCKILRIRRRWDGIADVEFG